MTLRNIRVGDDLSGKTLYMSFPSNLAQYVYDEITSYEYIIKTANSENFINETSERFSIGDRVYVFIGYQYCLYQSTRYDGEGWEVDSNLTSYVMPSNFGVVTQVNRELSTYQYIKIDGDLQPNVRNLKINGQLVNELKINGSIVTQSKINGQIVFK